MRTFQHVFKLAAIGLLTQIIISGVLVIGIMRTLPGHIGDSSLRYDAENPHLPGSQDPLLCKY